jgi:hypothetical protein
MNKQDALLVALNALQAIDDEHPYPIAKHAIVQISRVLAKPEPWDTSDMAHRSGGLSVEQKPVAWMVRDYVDGFRYVSSTENPSGTIAGLSEPLYTAPPKREWVGLTEKEIFEADNAGQGLIEFARAIETKLKGRNT